jgi:hypothetical protein
VILLYNHLNMSDQPRQRSPWRLSFFVFLGVTGFYLFLARPAEPVNDLIVKDDLAYLALGRAGLVIVDASIPDNPEEIGSFDTRGSANAVAKAGENAYIADGRDGLRIMDVSNPLQMVGLDYCSSTSKIRENPSW